MVWSYHGRIQQVPASDMRLLPLIRLVPVPSIILILSINKSLLDWFEHQQIFTCVETDLILSREGAVHTLGTFPYNDVYFQFPANWWRYSPVNYRIRLQDTNSNLDGSEGLIITTFFSKGYFEAN